MASYKSIFDVPPGEVTFSNKCIDGKCSGCGECCADLLPLTVEEVQRLKTYAKKHGLKAHTQAPFYIKDAVDFTCPFRNQIESKCDVYEIRPKICRSFICSKTLEQARHDRDLLHQKRSVYSLRYEVFGDRSLLDYLAQADAEWMKRIVRRAANGR